MWFTELAAARVGKISTTGTITEYAIPAPAQFINKASNGNLYFTMPTLQSLGEMTTAGVFVTQYPSGESPSEPWGLMGGPNRVDIWYLDRSANAVMSFNTQNLSLVPFTVPTVGSDPYAIAMAHDNNLWFTERAGNNIGIYVRLRMTVTPASITATQIGQQQSFTVVERKYSKLFTTTGCTANIATVSPGPAADFTVTAMGVGSCIITIHDVYGNMSQVPVTVM
jgi:streptogramin lyase